MAEIEVEPGELRAAAYAISRVVAALDVSMPRGGSGLGLVDDALAAFASRWSAVARAWVASLTAVAGAMSDAAETYDAVDTSAVAELSR